MCKLRLIYIWFLNGNKDTVVGSEMVLLSMLKRTYKGEGWGWDLSTLPQGKWWIWSQWIWQLKTQRKKSKQEVVWIVLGTADPFWDKWLPAPVIGGEFWGWPYSLEGLGHTGVPGATNSLLFMEGLYAHPTAPYSCQPNSTPKLPIRF